MDLLEQLMKGFHIFITPNSYKKKLLKDLAGSIYHIQFLTKEELRKKVLYEYRKDVLWHLTKEFQMLPENGAILLDAMYAVVGNEPFDLYEKKEWLKNHHLIITHPAFLNQLEGKKVWIFGYDPYEISFLEPILRKYAEVHYVEERGSYVPLVTEYETLEQEVVGVAEQISKLLNSGVSIDHIYLGCTSSEYRSVLSKIFHYFKIPLETSASHSLFEYGMVQTFLSLIDWEESFSQMDAVFTKMMTEYPTSNSVYQEIYESLTLILNSYPQNLKMVELKEILLYELKRKKVSRESCDHVVREVDFKTTVFDSSDYVFLMGMNLGENPTIYEDNAYLSDQQKKVLGIPTSFEMTYGEEQKIKHKITSLPHVFLSYKKKSPFGEYLPSSLIEVWKDAIQKGRYDYTNHAYNTYLLNSSLDDYVHFNSKSEHLLNLYGVEPLYYGSYNNQFTGISSEVFQKKVPYCVLSYTAMQKFFECPFKYYVYSILKIRPPFLETTRLMVGNLFHSILEQYFRRKEDLEVIIDRELEKVEMKPVSKKNFYFQKYRTEMKRLVLLMEQQLDRSSFRPTYFEETIEWLEEKQITFRIFGKLDKIMTVEEDGHYYIIVVDYKTGHATSDLSKVIYGMNMQLLLYLYLISREDRFSKYQLGGAYITSISASIPNYTEGKTIDDLFWEQSKLDGLTLNRVEFLQRLDQQYAESSYIKGIRVKKDGELSRSNRLLNPSTLDQLLDIVKRNIDIVEEAIGKAEFFVEPKKFSSENEIRSCVYCEYRDLCYLKPKDVKILKEYKNLEFLEEEK